MDMHSWWDSDKAINVRWKGTSSISIIRIPNGMKPPGFVNLKTTWEPATFRTNPSTRPVKHVPDVSPCPDICIKKERIAVSRLRSLSWRLEWRDDWAAEPASLELGSHLQEVRLLLHDAHQQRVNVVLQIFDLRLQLLQLHLPLCQQRFLPLKLVLLLLKLGLPLNQQSHQFTVVQVVIWTSSTCHKLRNHAIKIKKLKGFRAPATTDWKRCVTNKNNHLLFIYHDR